MGGWGKRGGTSQHRRWTEGVDKMGSVSPTKKKKRRRKEERTPTGSTDQEGATKKKTKIEQANGHNY